jgi:hypothetical protein
MYKNTTHEEVTASVERKHSAEIETVTPDMLVETFRNMERRVQACLDANGEHFQHLL